MDTLEEKKEPMLKYAASYGLIFGLAMILAPTINYVFKLNDQNTLLNILNWVIMIGGVILFTVLYRNNALGGYITYGQALGFGVVLMIFATVLSVVFTVMINIFDPAYVEEKLQMTADNLAQQGMSDMVIEQSLKMARAMLAPGWMLLIGILAGAFWGTIISLITSIFIKREKSVF